MQVLTNTDIALLSFPDTQVLEFSLDMNSKNFSVRCSDGYLDLPSQGTELSQVLLEITGFSEITINELSDDQLQLIPRCTPDFALKDICEFSAKEGEIGLKGFSKERGYWTEYSISGGSLRAYAAKS
ncbi:hypothetical protein [Oligoflexus tunisiensis]|uniref:hypothetical protein n=1 Tax=Oligoflexus tunisiensis TaxID=708132 RepID=UPI001C402B71|nr:hypothetical protein [Oligoflexus tunisiensis]